MTKIVTILILLLITATAPAQSVAINNNALPPDPSSMLDISSSTKGILIPRLRSSERLTIVNPAFGLMVFDVDTWSFWYYTIGGVWKEFTNNYDGPTGAAGGDLGGNYPNPHVKGLAFKPFANLNPGHLQIIKWENDADEWQFRNDSLTLPYMITDTSAGSLFSITNTKTGAAGSVMVGRYLTGSGIVPSFSGVWGDHTNGNGVSGTSNSGSGVFGYGNSGTGVSGNSISGIGVYGTSNGGHGVYGDGNSLNHAGVYGRNTTGGTAVWGDATTGNSYAIYGTNASGLPASRAGLFKHTNAAGTGTVFEATTVGLGRAAEFSILNTTNAQSAVVIQQNGTGSGLSSNTLNTGATSASVDASNNGNGAGVKGHSVNGKGVHGSSINSNAGYFETTFSGNTNATLAVNNNSAGSGLAVEGNSSSGAPLGSFVNLGTGRGLAVYNANLSNTATTAFFSTLGLGTSLYVERSNNTSGAPAAVIYNNGNADALDIQNLKQGTSAKLTNADASNTVPVILAEHKGSGRGIDLRMTKTTNNSTGVNIQHDGIGTGLFVMQTGTGKGAEINIGNTSNTQPGLFINSAAILGADISVTGFPASPSNVTIGLRSTIGSNAAINNAIAIQGISGLNDNNGRGVMGIARSGGAGSDATGVYGAGQFGTQAVGVKGISYHSTTDKGSVTGINLSSSSGVGVYGEGQGDQGTGIMGVSGTMNQFSYAARFKNFYSGNGFPVMQIETNSVGNGIFIEQTHITGSGASIRVKNHGVASFVSFEDQAGDKKTEIQKSGNIITDGALTVKTNKGIVRSTTSTQLRTEIVPAILVLPSNMTISAGLSYQFSITFAEPFSQPPAVSFGNLFDLAANPEAAFLTGSINSVSATGCNVKLMNPMNFNVNLNSGTVTWRLIAIGAE